MQRGRSRDRQGVAHLLRTPLGSLVDDAHFADAPPHHGMRTTSPASFSNLVERLHAQKRRGAYLGPG